MRRWCSVAGSMVLVVFVQVASAQGVWRHPRTYPPIAGVPQNLDGAEVYAREHPEDATAAVQLARWYVRAGRFDDAEHELERARLLPDAYPCLIRWERAELLLYRGDIEAGRALMVAAADEATDSFHAAIIWRRVGGVHRYCHNGVGAREAYTKAAEMCFYGRGSRRDSQLFADLAAVSISRERPLWGVMAAATSTFGASRMTYDQRVHLLETMEPLYPDEPLLYRCLSSLYASTGQPEEGLAAARRAVELEPESPVAHYILGQRLREQEEWAEAVIEFQRVAQLAGRYRDIAAGAHEAAAETHLEAGSFRQAYDSYIRSVDLHDHPIWHLPRFAFVALESGLTEKALSFADRHRDWALSAEDGDPPLTPVPAYAALAAVVGQPERMREIIEEALQRTAASKGTRQQELREFLGDVLKVASEAGAECLIGYVLWRGHDDAGARPHFEKALNIAPDLGPAHLYLAWALSEDDLTAAIEHAQKACDALPEGTVLHEEATRSLEHLLERLNEGSEGDEAR